MRLIIAGGGTGGHLFPGIAVAEEFLSRDPNNEVLFVGTERGIEARVLPKLGYRLACIATAGMRGKGLLERIKGIGLLLVSYWQSRAIIKEFRPDLVLGVGGYASGPLVLAAGHCNRACFVHEQNALLGLTNRLLAKRVQRVFLSLAESLNQVPTAKALLTGNPLRRQILAAMATERTARPDAAAFHVLVFGGSAGAHRINMAMTEALADLTGLGERLTITHQTGEQDLSVVQEAYQRYPVSAQVVPFIDNMAEAYRQADLIVCRAGATTIAEVTACGKACIFIPYPHATDDHQRKNAEALVSRGAGFMLLDRDLSGPRLASLLVELAADPARLMAVADKAAELAKPEAAQRIVDAMLAA
jgi:UDP-N-acetylglucosamine--N-acetylmuramyl-(pentapeptide) pyrophosphoryl-undecaprenol N-acetylglucosamine transferase